MANDTGGRGGEQVSVHCSIGHGLNQANNLTPHLLTGMDALDQIIDRHSSHINTLIDPAEGAGNRQGFDKLPDNIRKQIKHMGFYLIAAHTETGRRRNEDLTLCGVALLDIDNGNLKAADIQMALDLYDYKAWETITSRTGKRKWRVALPLAKNISAWHYEKAYLRWTASLPFNQHLDKTQGRPGQPALLPVLWDTQPTIIFSNYGEQRLDLTRYLNATDQVTDLPRKTEAFEHLHAPMDGVDRAHIEAVLDAISPEPEEDWIKVGRALHHQYRGTDEGLDIWKEWAKGCPEKYEPWIHEQKWGHLKVAPATTHPTTWRSIERLSRDRKRAGQEAKWGQVIATAEHEDALKTDIADALLRDKMLTKEQRERLGGLMSKRARQLGYEDWTAKDWRAILKPRLVEPDLELSLPASDQQGEDTDSPAQFDDIFSQARDSSIPKNKALASWKEEWVFLQNPVRFLNVKSGSVYKEESLNHMLDKFLVDPQTSRPIQPASKFMNNILCIPTAWDCMYYPHKPPIFRYHNQEWANQWRASSLPAGWDQQREDKGGLGFTVRQQLGILRFLRHVRYLVTGEDYRNFVYWLAWCVQNEGIKARWAVVLGGGQGTGKTVLGNIMQSVFGKDNANTVTGDVVISDSGFNPWASGHTFCVIEELRTPGKRDGSGFAVSQRLKPIIANDTIEVNQKFMPARTVCNTQNYLCLTNLWQPLSVESMQERRWFMVWSRIGLGPEAATMAERLRQRDHGRYFERLAALAEDKEVVLGLRRWLYNLPLNGWTTQTDAPKTKWFRELVEVSNAGSAHGAVPDLISMEWPGNDKHREWLVLSCMRDFIANHGYDGEFNVDKVLGARTTVAAALGSAGYERFGRTRINGHQSVVYIHARAHATGGLLERHQYDGSNQGTRRVLNHIKAVVERQQKKSSDFR